MSNLCAPKSFKSQDNLTANSPGISKSQTEYEIDHEAEIDGWE